MKFSRKSQITRKEYSDAKKIVDLYLTQITTKIDYYESSLKFNPPIPEKVYLIDLDMSVRLYNVLHSFFYHKFPVWSKVSLMDVSQYTREDFLSIRNMGEVAVNELELLLKSINLSFANELNKS